MIYYKIIGVFSFPPCPDNLIQHTFIFKIATLSLTILDLCIVIVTLYHIVILF